MPNGARFYRCALQIELGDNIAIIQACLDQHIEVIGITDYRIAESFGLIETARAARIHVFLSFEAVTMDGVLILCLFDQDKSIQIKNYLGECGTKDSQELLQVVKDCGGVGIAAHIVGGRGDYCFIKMSHVSTEGLRQAFLDPESRILLKSNQSSEEHAEFLALAWQGGFLDGVKVHFNDNLNVLIGGRGTGKSTIIESIRYVLALDPLGDEAQRAHMSIVQNVLKNGTKISLLLRLHYPGKRYYTFERTIPNPPVVKDENGEVLNLMPGDVFSGVEIFGQHEISELTRSREKLTWLLERFIERDAGLGDRKSAVQRELGKSRVRSLDILQKIGHIEERLAILPALEEPLRKFQDAGLELKLKEKSLFVREERVFALMRERLQPWRQMESSLQDNQPIDTAFLNDKALTGLPNAAVLQQAGQALVRLNAELANIFTILKHSLDKTASDITVFHAHWEGLKANGDENYEKILRELQKTNLDGEAFIQLRRQIEELHPLKERCHALQRDLEAQLTHRRNLLKEWDNLKREDFQGLTHAAKKISAALQGRVRVEVTNAGNRDPLIRLLRNEVGGHLKAVEERLMQRPNLSLTDFAQRCREGRDALIREYELTSGEAERIMQKQPELSYQIDELELTATTKIELNIGNERVPDWKELEQLSTGQKATAVLLILLLESKAPLIVDQPEDDLDNRFITDSVVLTIRREKSRRQFIFSTHNANIPVLGDAELIIGLTASDKNARISQEYIGSLDAEPVRVMVEEILEGGKVAFETRRQKYGF